MVIINILIEYTGLLLCFHTYTNVKNTLQNLFRQKLIFMSVLRWSDSVLYIKTATFVLLALIQRSKKFKLEE